MQTNREDVGDRYHEIEIPLAPDIETAARVSQPFRDYFLALAAARDTFRSYLANGEHHVFVSGAEIAGDESAAELEAAERAVDTVVEEEDNATQEPVMSRRLKLVPPPQT